MNNKLEIEAKKLIARLYLPPKIVIISIILTIIINVLSNLSLFFLMH